MNLSLPLYVQVQVFYFIGQQDTRDFLLAPSNKTITEMDTAVFTCVPAKPSFQAVWSFSTLNATIGPNGYYIGIIDVETSDAVSCTTNGNITDANLTVQGKFDA